MSLVPPLRTEAVPAKTDPDLPAANGSSRLEHGLFRVFRGLLAALPRPWALRLGAWLGSLLYLVDARDRRVALTNLRLAFPEKSEAERRSILRRSCRNLGRVAVEYCHFDRLTKESIDSYVRIANPAVWQSTWAIARERGAIILTAHLGNFELLAYAHGLMGCPVTIVHRPMRNQLVDREIIDWRARAGTSSIAKRAAAKAIMRALRNREMVAIPADQNQTRRFGIFVDFFGIPASTTPGPARIAAITGVPVFPVFLVREGETERHRIEVLPQVEMVDTGDREADIVTNTQRCTAAIEEVVRAHPDQWIWFHKRWRTRPEGEPKLY
jgi:KDO2-lipid IV(A) lauroyltransferase